MIMTQDGERRRRSRRPRHAQRRSTSTSQGVRESGQQDLPGNPANIGGASGDDARDVDDDYYFAGVYTTAAGDGGYEPVGVVSESESYYDRALTSRRPKYAVAFQYYPKPWRQMTTSRSRSTSIISARQTAADISSYDLTILGRWKASRRNAAPYGY